MKTPPLSNLDQEMVEGEGGLMYLSAPPPCTSSQGLGSRDKSFSFKIEKKTKEF